MSHWNRIRQVAIEYRKQAITLTNGDLSAVALIKAASNITELNLNPVCAGDPLLEGGEAMLDIDNEAIWYSQDLNPRVALLYQAHEFGHFWLHQGHTVFSPVDIDMDDTDDPLPFGAHRVEGYSPEEREEREANVFAREFLLPTEEARALFTERGWGASEMRDI